MPAGPVGIIAGKIRVLLGFEVGLEVGFGKWLVRKPEVPLGKEDFAGPWSVLVCVLRAREGERCAPHQARTLVAEDARRDFECL